MAIPTAVSRNPVRMTAAGRRLPALLPAMIAVANMVRERGASERPASMALYSRVICRNNGSTIIAPPSETCCSSWPETPVVKLGERNRSGSSSVTRFSRLRRTSQRASETSAIAPTTISRTTNSPPSCQTRMPSTTPPMPTTDRTAPTLSISREPVYATSLTSRIWLSTTAMMTTSRAKPTRQDRYVVTKPPSSGPTAAAMAAAAPIRAYACFWAAPAKLPWTRDCIAGSSSDAPSPPMIAQKMTMAVRLWASVMAAAPMAYAINPRT